jgi:hypothetical protein
MKSTMKKEWMFTMYCQCPEKRLLNDSTSYKRQMRSNKLNLNIHTNS